MSNAASNTQTPQRFSGEWETKQLKELGQFSKGRGIKRDDVSDEGLPCVRYGELYTRYQDYILKIASRIPPSVAATALPIKKGDLLFAGSGETAEEIGRCAAYLGEEQAYAGGDVIVLTPSGQNSIYLGHLMNSPIVSAQKARLGQGDAVVHIYINNLAQVQIELPPITEQNAIAEVLSDVDGLLNALDALIDKKRAIKQAAMQQLLTGKTCLPGFSETWETKRFEDLFKRLNGNSHKIQTSEYNVNGLHPVIDQGQDTVVGYSDQTEKLFKCPAGGVIVFGDHTRIVKFVDVDFLIGADGTQLLAARRIDVAKFLFYQLSTKDIPDTGYNRHFKFLKDLTFKIPEPEEQHAIASVLSDMDAEIAALEQRRDKTIAIKQGMMQSLLTGRVRLSESRIDADDADDAD